MLADRVTVLRDGAYVATREVVEVSEDDLVHMMVGRTIENLFPKLDARIGAPLLEVRGLSRAPAFRDVDLVVRAGEVVGLAGLVGSGRSEVAQAIFGMDPVDRGQVLVDGKPVRITSPGQAKRLGIAYVPEDRATQGLIKPMCLRENISLAVLRQVAPAWLIDRRAETTLAEDSIETFRIRASSVEQIAEKLSGGNQQKVVLAKWLGRNCRLLIVDEPTRGVDIGAKAAIHGLIDELAQSGVGVLLISSELPELLNLSTRVLVMREGRLVGELSRDELTQDRALRMMAGVAEA
jgi:rhamnose transport system ATP-binding protein